MSEERPTYGSSNVRKHLEQQKIRIQSIEDAIITIGSLIEDAQMRIGMNDIMSIGDTELVEQAGNMCAGLQNDKDCIIDTGRRHGRYMSDQQQTREITNNIQKVLTWALHQDNIHKGLTTERYSWSIDHKPNLADCVTRAQRLLAFETFVRKRMGIRQKKYFFMARHARARIDAGTPYIGDYRLVLSMESNIAKTLGEQQSILDSLNALEKTTSVEFIRTCMTEMLKLNEPSLVSFAHIAARVFQPAYQENMSVKDQVARELLSDRVAFEAEVQRWLARYRKTLFE